MEDLCARGWALFQPSEEPWEADSVILRSPPSLRRGSEHRESHKSGHDEATVESQVCMIRKSSSQLVYYAGEESSIPSKRSPLVAQQRNSPARSAGSAGASGGRRYGYRMTKTEGLVTWNRVESFHTLRANLIVLWS